MFIAVLEASVVCASVRNVTDDSHTCFPSPLVPSLPPFLPPPIHWVAPALVITGGAVLTTVNREEFRYFQSVCGKFTINSTIIVEVVSAVHLNMRRNSNSTSHAYTFVEAWVARQMVHTPCNHAYTFSLWMCLNWQNQNLLHYSQTHCTWV